MRARTRWIGLAATLLLAACGGEPGSRETPAAEVSEDAKRGGLAVACAQAAPEGLNPFVSADQLSVDLRLLLFTPLVLYESDDFRPYLATSWSWEDGGRRLTFQLRRDITWHDGAPLTPDDVAWTIRAAADTSYAYWSQSDFASLVEVGVSDSSVTLSFDRPFTAGLEPFASLPVLPRHLLDTIPAGEFQRARYHREPVGSGPFRFAGRSPDGSITFDRASDFPEDLGSVYLDRVIFRAIPEATTLQTEIQSGGVDMCITGLSVAERVEGMPRSEVLLAEPTGVMVMPLNLRHPPLDDVRVRRALSAALRRAEIAAVLSDLARPTRTFLPPASRWVDPDLTEPDSDSAMAARLLDDAGWTRPTDGSTRTNSAGEPLRLTLIGPTGFENAGTVIQAQLARVGVDVDLQFMEGGSFFSTILNPETRPDMMALVLYPEKFLRPDVMGQFHSSGNANLSFYSDPRVDSIAEALETTVDPQQLDRLYRAAQRQIVQDMPAIHAVYLPRPVAVGPRLEGVRVDLNGPFASVSEWWIPPAQRRRGR